MHINDATAIQTGSGNESSHPINSLINDYDRGQTTVSRKTCTFTFDIISESVSPRCVHGPRSNFAAVFLMHTSIIFNGTDYQLDWICVEVFSYSQIYRISEESIHILPMILMTIRRQEQWI